MDDRGKTHTSRFLTASGWTRTHAGSIRLLGRNAVDHTRRFPEVAVAVAKLRSDVLVLDGEVAVFDEHLVSRFHLLGDSDTGVLCTPPMFIAFDVLQIGQGDIRSLPLMRRRSILEDAIADSEIVLPVRRLDAHGSGAWETVERRGFEEFVAKDPQSTYRSGTRLRLGASVTRASGPAPRPRPRC